jgi:ubiquitin-conjugating enzyme E2 G1
MNKKTIKIINKHVSLFNAEPINGVTIGLDESDISNCEFTITGPKDTLYEDGIFKGKFKFPNNYPYAPPDVRLTTPIYHPNFYTDGRVCISILHQGEDETGYEKSSERWSPVQTIASVLLSVISLISSPNSDSPANVDAAKDWRSDKEGFKKKVRKCVRDSLELFDSNKSETSESKSSE